MTYQQIQAKNKRKKYDYQEEKQKSSSSKSKIYQIQIGQQYDLVLEKQYPNEKQKQKLIQQIQLVQRSIPKNLVYSLRIVDEVDREQLNESIEEALIIFVRQISIDSIQIQLRGINYTLAFNIKTFPYYS